MWQLSDTRPPKARRRPNKASHAIHPNARTEFANSMKPVFRRLYAVLVTRKLELHRQVEALGKETQNLRAKLAALQNAKTLAENQAEELRKDKERLRAKIAAMKKSAEQADNVTQQLRTKHEQLQKDYAALKIKVTRPR
jgi:chromosome segregation ATPase